MVRAIANLIPKIKCFWEILSHFDFFTRVETSAYVKYMLVNTFPIISNLFVMDVIWLMTREKETLQTTLSAVHLCNFGSPNVVSKGLNGIMGAGIRSRYFPERRRETGLNALFGL